MREWWLEVFFRVCVAPSPSVIVAILYCSGSMNLMCLRAGETLGMVASKRRRSPEVKQLSLRGRRRPPRCVPLRKNGGEL